MLTVSLQTYVCVLVLLYIKQILYRRYTFSLITLYNDLKKKLHILLRDKSVLFISSSTISFYSMSLKNFFYQSLLNFYSANLIIHCFVHNRPDLININFWVTLTFLKIFILYVSYVKRTKYFMIRKITKY